MTDEQRSVDDTAPRGVPGAQERRLARRALAGRARDAADLSLLMDMLGLDPCRDPGRQAPTAAGPPTGQYRRGPVRGQFAVAGEQPGQQ
ncbi:hypothetical protein ACWEQ8_35225, partial [Streptomyces noursei]